MAKRYFRRLLRAGISESERPPRTDCSIVDASRIVLVAYSGLPKQQVTVFMKQREYLRAICYFVVVHADRAQAAAKQRKSLSSFSGIGSIYVKTPRRSMRFRH